MKGRSVSAVQKRYHSTIAELGCIACRKMGYLTPHVSIHHIDGRTKRNAHWLVLPLCGPHHQDAGVPGIYAVHPWKPRFENAYGNQIHLLRECIQLLQANGQFVPEAALIAAGINQKENPALLEQ